MQRTFRIISDPGHAWCKVPLPVLAELRIIEAITCFSFIRRGTAYLEEDCDLSAFVAAYKEETGVSPIFRESTADKPSRVRNYEGYSVTEAADWSLRSILNLALHRGLSEKQKATARYLLQLSPNYMSQTFLKDYLQSEGRLEVIHIGG